MIAMHYRFPLPADYDMAIIDRRIAEKGHLTDGFPGLLFKAYLCATKGEAGQDNAYAPFYVWRSVQGMHAFLNGPGFAAVSASFGRPAVATWLVWQARVAAGFEHARFASVERRAIPPGTDLAVLRDSETARLDDAVHGAGALAAVVGMEPTTWTLVRFRLWEGEPALEPETFIYEVGHVSTESIDL
jgi:hypothetical protein